MFFCSLGSGLGGLFYGVGFFEGLDSDSVFLWVSDVIVGFFSQVLVLVGRCVDQCCCGGFLGC